MKTCLLTGILGGALLLAPLSFAHDNERKPSPSGQKRATQDRTASADRTMSEDMREAIAWERAKDRAAARQARIEARRGRTEATSERSADRGADDKDTGRKVKDTKAPGARRDQ
jgi:hypothetical protein